MIKYEKDVPRYNNRKLLFPSFLLLYVALTAVTDVAGMDEVELDFDDEGAGGTGADGAMGTSAGADGADNEVVTGSGLGTLSESELLAGESETSHLEFGDPSAILTPEAIETLPSSPPLAEPRTSATCMSVHYTTT